MKDTSQETPITFAVELADENDEEDKQSTPDELKLENVDMNDPKMDPLEWFTRKVISIPKEYYWETGNYDVSARTKIWHRSIRTLGLTLKVAEKVGEVLANITGINNSRFNHITDHMNDEEWEQARKIAEESRMKRQSAKEAEQQTRTIQVV